MHESSAWGGYLRFAARRGVHVTGITLSRDQAAFDRKLITDNGFDAEVHYQDFFTYQPRETYDGITLMGVIEDLSEYHKVIPRLEQWVRPGGRVYFDFATAKDRFGTTSFITKHIWPGLFRMVYLPEFIEAVGKSSFEIVSIENDRKNYHLWTKKLHERWIEHKDEIVKRSSEALWRTFRVLFAGTSAIMDTPTYSASACRVVLERPADYRA